MLCWKAMFLNVMIASTGQLYSMVTASQAQFKCSKSCAQTNDTSLLSPVVVSRRSRLECSSTCAKFSWCLKYIFTQDYRCLLVLLNDGACPPEVSGSTMSVSTVSVCTRSLDTSYATSCRMTRKMVLDEGFYQVDYESLLQMLVVGNDVKIRYSSSNSTFVSSAVSYVTPMNVTLPILSSVPLYITSLTLPRVPLMIRTFSTSSTAVQDNYYNSVLNGSSAVLNVSQWITQLKSGNPLGNKIKIFQTGANVSSLTAAVDSGYGINFLVMLGSAVRYLTSTVVIRDGQNTNAQSYYFENRKIKFTTLRSNDTPLLVTWDYIGKYRNETETMPPENIWYADPCWSYITNTPSSDSMALQKIKTALLSGRKLRVAFIVDTLMIYATPSYLSINATDIVTSHVVNVIKRTTGLSSKRHYILSTDGFLQEFAVDFGSDTIQGTDKTTSIKWFVDSQNFTLVHSTTAKVAPNATTFTALQYSVSNGSEIRVKIFVNLTESHFFTCDSLQTYNDGSSVQCFITGQLAVDYLGSTLTTSQSGSGCLLNLILCSSSSTTSYTPTVISGCPQFVTVNTNGAMTSYISCLEVDATVKNVTEQWVNVDWFAAV